ncbi:hypothetical protein Pan258_18080 [Symmachiella dynata]|uniref:hypothetical protein n=1 Tax=Symmachiella dynata TaxID=2527995 RepID=UPI001189927C|nr:hypothetical protein [Symmachiella dynata]QDT47771.1 hypothetical protein Pan258_18080 [Symmachiella dynata]
MTIQVSCNNCGKTYNVSDNIAGRQIRCKECETIIYVPAEEPIEAVEVWDDDDEFGEHAALPPRRRRPSGPAYEDQSPRQGLSGTQIVLMVVGAGFLLLLLACGGVAYMVIERAQEVIAEVQEGIEEMEAEARAAREQRAAEMAEAELAPLDLAAVGLPLVIDMPEGTTVEAVERSDSVGDDETNSSSVYFHYGTLIQWQMSKNPKYETVEDLKKHVMQTYGKLPKDIEVVDEQVVIYKYEIYELMDDSAVYNFMALVTVGEDRLLFQEAAGELYTREEVEYFANCIKTLRPQGQSVVETPSDEAPAEETTPEEAPAIETPPAETLDEEASVEVGEEK